MGRLLGRARAHFCGDRHGLFSTRLCGGLLALSALLSVALGCSGQDAEPPCRLAELHSCPDEKWPCCGQTWNCGDTAFTIAVSSNPVSSTSHLDTLLLFACKARSTAGDDIRLDYWPEYLEGRSYNNMCLEINSGRPGDTQPGIEAGRSLGLCAWEEFAIDVSTGSACSPGRSKYLVVGRLAGGDTTVKDTFATTLNIPESERTCGTHRYVYSAKDETGCLADYWLRYDATTKGLVHASLMELSNCSVPNRQRWFAAQLSPAE